MASTSKQAQQTGKAITFSFRDGPNDSEIICLDDTPTTPILPKHNLNNTVVDLTYDSPSSQESNASQGRKKVPRTMHLDMELSSAGPSRVTRSVSKQNPQNRPGPSRHLTRLSINEPCYKKLQEMMEKPLIENYEDFNCILCKKLILKHAGVMLKECLHLFCRMCLIDKINATPAGRIRVDCPNVPEICESFISMEEINALLGDGFEEFVRRMGDETSTESILPILLQMNDLPVIPNIQAFTCQVCFGDVEVGEGILLKNCLHNGCKECLSQLIQHTETFEVNCPFVENEVSCKEFIQEQEMRSLVTEEVFDKHIKKSLKIAEFVNELYFHCRGLDCENFVELTEGITSFKCKACNQVNCIPCKAVHPGKSCQEYQEDVNPEVKNSRLNDENKKSEEAIAAEIAAGTAMLCPRCQIPVMKITGCDFITCTACKLGICWVTRKPRKEFKKGSGEVVAGCYCKEPPLMKRCHPKCGNCH